MDVTCISRIVFLFLKLSFQVLICRNEAEKCLIETSINSLRISLKVKPDNYVWMLLMSLVACRSNILLQEHQCKCFHLVYMIKLTAYQTICVGYHLFIFVYNSMKLNWCDAFSFW